MGYYYIYTSSGTVYTTYRYSLMLCALLAAIFANHGPTSQSPLLLPPVWPSIVQLRWPEIRSYDCVYSCIDI